MALTKLGPADANTVGNLPAVGSTAPDFIFTSADMKDVKLADYKGKNIVLNIFPSVDTNVCAASVHEFNKLAASVDNTVIFCVSKDLPFAQKRFCGAEELTKYIWFQISAAAVLEKPMELNYKTAALPVYLHARLW